MSHFLATADGLEPERLEQLQQVYDWFAPTVEDKQRLALALLAVPAERVTFEQIIEVILADLDPNARSSSVDVGEGKA